MESKWEKSRKMRSPQKRKWWRELLKRKRRLHKKRKRLHKRKKPHKKRRNLMFNWNTRRSRLLWTWRNSNSKKSMS